jgi:hypothetical protein
MLSYRKALQCCPVAINPTAGLAVYSDCFYKSCGLCLAKMTEHHTCKRNNAQDEMRLNLSLS